MLLLFRNKTNIDIGNTKNSLCKLPFHKLSNLVVKSVCKSVSVGECWLSAHTMVLSELKFTRHSDICIVLVLDINICVEL